MENPYVSMLLNPVGPKPTIGTRWAALATVFTVIPFTALAALARRGSLIWRGEAKRVPGKSGAGSSVVQRHVVLGQSFPRKLHDAGRNRQRKIGGNHPTRECASRRRWIGGTSQAREDAAEPPLGIADAPIDFPAQP